MLVRMKKRVILSAGGTGGHLFPAQNFAQTLPEWEILFVAGGLSSNRYFDRNQFLFKDIECATFAFSQPLKLLKGSRKIYRGLCLSRKIIKQFKPDLVIGFGSFYTLPLLLAALIEKIPIVLHEQNILPGKVNKLFSPFALKTTVTFPATKDFLKGRAKKEAIEVFFPTQRNPFRANCDDAWSYFNLTSGVTTLLVFGGSQGAKRLNQLFLEALSKLSHVQVLHFTGSEERSHEAKSYYERLGIKACVKEFEKRMDLAMQIADFAITRAGAATLVELIENALPALLIPYPFAADNHQEKNGTHFVSIVKGGTMYKESELNAEMLAEAIQQQLIQVKALKKNITTYKKQREAQHLADVIRSLYEN